MSETRVLTFAEKEMMCEESFMMAGQFWHLYTDGTRMGNIFLNDNDLNAGMAILAACAKVMYPEAILVTFELMKNHIHLILCGNREACLRLFVLLKDKLRRVFKKTARGLDWKVFQAEILPIESLKALRNEIIYTHRNAFVANPTYTPFSYQWGGGCAYFNPMIKEIRTDKISSFSIDRQRELTYSRDTCQLGELKFSGERVYIPSFCNIRLGESMFTDARSYFFSLSRNAEAFSQIAARLKDKVFLTDDEIYAAALNLAGKEFGAGKITTLTPEQKIRLSKDLHFRYNASNHQLRRVLKLDIAVLNELFPE